MSDESDEDDDLPVLTQVLRIGSGRASPAPMEAHATTDAADAIDATPLDELLLDDQLVIGTEPRENLEPYVPLTTPLPDRSANEDDPVSQSQSAFTQSLIVPFSDSVDVPATQSEAATLDEPTSPSDLGMPREGTADESRDAANDANDAASDAASDVADEAATSDSASNDAVNDAAAHMASAAPAAIDIDPVPASETAFVDTAPPPPFDEDAFAVRVQEAVLNGISARIDTELDARIAQSMRAELESALASLQANLREQLAEAMRDVVRRAVDEELVRVRETMSATPRE